MKSTRNKGVLKQKRSSNIILISTGRSLKKTGFIYEPEQARDVGRKMAKIASKNLKLKLNM